MERMLVAAWDSGGTPLIVLTKADLGNMINGNQDVVADVVRYSAGAEVFTTSSELGDGIEALRERIRAHGGLDYRATLTLLGPSGAGKSSLVNALIGDDIQDTREVREGDYKGKHTTYRARAGSLARQRCAHGQSGCSWICGIRRRRWHKRGLWRLPASS